MNKQKLIEWVKNKIQPEHEYTFGRSNAENENSAKHEIETNG